MNESIGPISPCFLSNDVPRSISFYCERLGFELRFATPTDAPFFAIVGRGSVQLHLKDPRESLDDSAPPQPNVKQHAATPWDAFVYVADPDALAQELGTRMENGAPTVEQRADGLFGFAVADPEGYVLFFGRPT